MKVHVYLTMTAALVGLTGCIGGVVPALSHKVISGTKIDSGDVAYIQLGVTQRDEITSRLGPPWADYGDIHVLVYYWETLAGHKFMFLMGKGESAGFTDEITKLHYLFIKLDPRGTVLKWEIIKHPKSKPVKTLAEEWSRAIAQ